jgi:hypothetical protein
MNNPARVIDRIHSAYGRASLLATDRHTWTLEPPPWWQPRSA